MDRATKGDDDRGRRGNDTQAPITRTVPLTVYIMPICLYCRLSPVWPEEPAGLCVSCRASVARGEVAVLAVGGCVILQARLATPLEPLGSECSDAGQLYTPEEHSFFDPAGQSEMRSQLLSLALDVAPKRLHLQARDVVDELRACGLIVGYDTGLAVAYIDRPRAAPYLLLVRFLELQPEIADVLTLESREKSRNVQLEHSSFRGISPGLGNPAEVRCEHLTERVQQEAIHHDDTHMSALQTG